MYTSSNEDIYIAPKGATPSRSFSSVNNNKLLLPTENSLPPRGNANFSGAKEQNLFEGVEEVEVLPDVPKEKKSLGSGGGKKKKAPKILTAEEQMFDEFRKAYGGYVRGLQVEFENFKKKHSDWKEVLPTLLPLYEKQREAWRLLELNGEFVPEEKYLQTYINQRCWEGEVPEPKQRISAGAKTIYAAEKLYREGKELEQRLDEEYANRTRNTNEFDCGF